MLLQRRLVCVFFHEKLAHYNFIMPVCDCDLIVVGVRKPMMGQLRSRSPQSGSDCGSLGSSASTISSHGLGFGDSFDYLVSNSDVLIGSQPAVAPSFSASSNSSAFRPPKHVRPSAPQSSPDTSGVIPFGDAIVAAADSHLTPHILPPVNSYSPRVRGLMPRGPPVLKTGTLTSKFDVIIFKLL